MSQILEQGGNQSRVKKLVFLGLGWLFVGFAVVGALMPILPTVPFLLLAAFFFQHSSQRFHDCLLRQPYFGPIILDYQRHRVIRLKAKIQAIVMLWLLIVLALWRMNDLSLVVKVALLAIALAVSAFIASQKSRHVAGSPSGLYRVHEATVSMKEENGN
jgi:hypothetical protein